MARFCVYIESKRTLTEKQVARLIKIVGDKFDRENVTGQNEKSLPTSIQDRVAEVIDRLSGCESDVDEIKSELENWRDSIPENLQNCDKYQSLEQCVSDMDSVISSVQDASSSLESIDIPGMFG